jgi:hypothetical protein
MVHILDDSSADDIREVLQVHDIARGLIDLAGHNDLEDLVVPVQIRALSEQPLILLIGEGRITQPGFSEGSVRG